MTLELIAGDIMTGLIQATLPASDGDFSQVLNDAGKVDATLPLGALNLAKYPELLAQVEPARTFIGMRVVETQQVLEAGPVWSHDYDGAAQTLKVAALGMASIFDHRKLVPVLTGTQRAQDQVLNYTALSLGTIAARLISVAMSHTGGNLPIVLPADVGAHNDTAHQRSYPGSELGNVWQRVKAITTVEGGPDITLQPQMKDNTHVQWVMRTGTDVDPLLHQIGADWQWDGNAQRSSLMAMSVKRDASQMAFRAWAVGSGQGQQMTLGKAEDLSQVTAGGYPLLEVSQSYSNDILQATVDGHAAALLTVSSRPWQTWTLTVDPSGTPRLGDYRPGDWCQAWMPAGHPYIPAGAYRTRILTVSGNLTGGIKVEMAPTLDHR